MTTTNDPSRDKREPRKPMNPNFFQREADGSVRLRIRFTAEEAAQIEEGAGTTPLMLYIHRVLNERSAYHIRKRAEQEAAQTKNGTVTTVDLSDDDEAEDGLNQS